MAALREVDRRGVVARILRGRHGDGHASVVDLPDRQVPEPPARERLHRKRRGAVLVVDELEVFVERGLREDLVVVADVRGSGRVREEVVGIRGEGRLVRELRRAGGSVDEVEVASAVLVETIVAGSGFDDRRVGDRQRRPGVLRGHERADHRSAVDDREHDAVVAVAELDFSRERERRPVLQRKRGRDPPASDVRDGGSVDDDVVRFSRRVPGRRAVDAPVGGGQPKVVGRVGRAGPGVGVGERLGAEQDRRERREGFRFHMPFLRRGFYFTMMTRGMTSTTIWPSPTTMPGRSAAVWTPVWTLLPATVISLTVRVCPSG